MKTNLKTKIAYACFLIGISSTLLGIWLLIPEIGEAFGEMQHKNIGIEWSESCHLLISLNDTETCSDPEFLKSWMLETLPGETAKNLIDTENDAKATQLKKAKILENHKIQCISKGYCEIFDSPFRQFNIWYDPENKVRNYLDTIITIEPRLLHSNIDRNLDVINVEENGRNIHFEVNQLYVQYCHKVNYSPEQILYEFGNLLVYVLTDCKNPEFLGSLNQPIVKKLDSHVLDVQTSPNWQYLQELEELKKKYKENRLGKD